MEHASRNDMSQQSRKTAVRLWRYGRNTGILAHSTHDTIDDLGMLWDHSQSISTHEKPSDRSLQHRYPHSILIYGHGGEGGPWVSEEYDFSSQSGINHRLQRVE
jgi:hypothetical protein